MNINFRTVLLSLSLVTPIFSLQAESNNFNKDNFQSMESEGAYKDRTELLKKFNKLSLDKQQLLFFVLISSKRIDDIETILKSGFEINYLKKGFSPLHIAITYKHFKTIKALIDNGADLSFKTRDEDTPLHLAISSGDMRIIKLFVENGAKLEARDGSQETALKSAVRTKDIEILEYLISKGADVNGHGKGGTSPLTTATFLGDKVAIELLVKNGADILYSTEKDNWTLLHYAAKYNHIHLIDYFIKNGIKVDARSNNGWSALATASEKGNLEIVEKLINYSSDVELPTRKFGSTPLMIASLNGHTKVVKRLLKAGADFERKNKSDHAPLWLAANNSHSETVKVLLEVVNEPNEVYLRASSKGDYEVVRTLIKSGIDVHSRTKKGSTALHLAAKFGHLNTVKLLQKNGADIHAIATVKKDTPLMRAAGWGKVEVIKYLIEQGAEVDIKNNYGWTAALSTARHHSLDTLKLLIKNGADIHQATDSGWTILMVAVKGKKRKTIEYLLKQDLDLEMKNKKGQTALDLAIIFKNENIIEMLKKALSENPVISST